MPKPITTRFTKFEFTNEELYAATRFNQLQLMLIQQLIAEAAERKSNLKIDLKDKTRDDAITEYIQQEAECTGEIGALEHLLMLANETEAPQPESAQEPAQLSKSSQSLSQPNRSQS